MMRPIPPRPADELLPPEHAQHIAFDEAELLCEDLGTAEEEEGPMCGRRNPRAGGEGAGDGGEKLAEGRLAREAHSPPEASRVLGIHL